MRPAEINMFNPPALARRLFGQSSISSSTNLQKETSNSKRAILYACRKHQDLLEKVIKAITRKRFLSFRPDAERHEKG